jgi:hypothetical protein
MNKRNIENKNKSHIEKAITNMIDEGSEDVTTLSKDVEAKYESIGEKIPDN